jgi:hypothetical protein
VRSRVRDLGLLLRSAVNPMGRRLGTDTFGCINSRIAERMAPMARSCSVSFYPVGSRAARSVGRVPCWRRRTVKVPDMTYDF